MDPYPCSRGKGVGWMSADASEVDTLALIRLMLPRVSEVPADTVDEATLITDLAVNSLRFMELIAEMEDRLTMTLSDEEIMQVRTVGDIVTVIERRRANLGGMSNSATVTQPFTSPS